MSWREGWTRIRNRLLAAPGFQRWAGKFVLTRPIARAKAAALFDLTAGFVYSQILLAVVELEILQRLSAGPMSAQEIGREAGLPPDGASRLLKASAALELLEFLPGERVCLGPLGAALLANPGVIAMIRHHRLLYNDLADPAGLLRGERGASLATFWAYSGAAEPARTSERDVAAYSDLMTASQQMIAEAVLDAVSPGPTGCLLDIGGGEGGFLAAALARQPRMGGILFDLPAVAARAGHRLAPFGARVQICGGDVFATPLPPGADQASLIRVLHDHNEAEALAILRRARAALPDGGRLILAEPMAGEPGSGRVADAYFGLYFAAMGSGRARTRAELTGLLSEAGFTQIRRISTPIPLIVSVLTARAARQALA